MEKQEKDVREERFESSVVDDSTIFRLLKPANSIKHEAKDGE